MVGDRMRTKGVMQRNSLTASGIQWWRLASASRPTSVTGCVAGVRKKFKKSTSTTTSSSGKPCHRDLCEKKRSIHTLLVRVSHSTWSQNGTFWGIILLSYTDWPLIYFSSLCFDVVSWCMFHVYHPRLQLSKNKPMRQLRYKDIAWDVIWH